MAVETSDVIVETCVVVIVWVTGIMEVAWTVGVTGIVAEVVAVGKSGFTEVTVDVTVTVSVV